MNATMNPAMCDFLIRVNDANPHIPFDYDSLHELIVMPADNAGATTHNSIIRECVNHLILMIELSSESEESVDCIMSLAMYIDWALTDEHRARIRRTVGLFIPSDHPFLNDFASL